MKQAKTGVSLLVLMIALAAAPLHAQIGRRAPIGTGPDYWVGLSIGVLDGATIVDGNTGSTWQLGYSSQIRATFEMKLQPGFTGGVSAGFSTAPLTYFSGTTFAATCGSQCQADADITQWMAFIRGNGGGGYGFHGEFDLEAGVTSFSNFHVHDTSTQLAPTDTHYDFTFGLGGGIGYSVTPTAEIYVNEVADWVLHDQGAAVATTAPRVYSFRLGARVGF